MLFRFGLVRASIDAAQVPGGLAGTELRWLQSGAGWVRQGAASDPAQSQAPVPTPAALSAARPVQLRAQLWRGGMPIEEPSNPYLLDGSASLPGVIPDSSYSGTWYSPLHDGEGFMLEMLPAGRFIAYWFTYDPSAAVSGPVGSAAQHWLLADGQQDGRALRAPLLRALPRVACAGGELMGVEGLLRWRSEAGELTRQPARSLWQRIENLVFRFFPANLY